MVQQNKKKEAFSFMVVGMASQGNHETGEMELRKLKYLH